MKDPKAQQKKEKKYAKITFQSCKILRAKVKLFLKKTLVLFQYCAHKAAEKRSDQTRIRTQTRNPTKLKQLSLTTVRKC